MNSFNIEPLHFENADVTLDSDQDGVCLTIMGDIDMRDTFIDFLPYLLKVHEALIQNKIKLMKLNLLKLTFLNSNGIKSLINWIMKLTELPVENQYKVHITASTDIAWQESTLPVLQKLFPDCIVIEQM